MPKGGGIPEKTNDFHAYINQVIPLLMKNRERLNIPPDETEQLRVELGEKQPDGSYPLHSWNDLYEKRANPVTSSGFIKHALRAKRKKIDKMLRQIYGSCVWYMNEEEKALTGRKLRKAKNSRAPVPDRAPHILILSQRHCMLTLRFRDLKHPSLRRNPEKFSLVWVEYFVQIRKNKIERGYTSTGKWYLRLKLKPEYYGKKLRLRARYFNRRGEGPWSDWVSTFVI